MVDHAHIILHGVHRRISDGEGCLGDHPGLLGVFHAELEVAMVVQAAEGTGDVGTLGLLDLEHQFAHICGNRIHTQGIEPAFQHMCLDPGLMEGCSPLADGDVRVFAVEEIDLLEGAAVGLHAVETSHIYNCRSDPHELVHPGLVFSGRLPHIPVDQGKLDFVFHTSFCHSRPDRESVLQIY